MTVSSEREFYYNNLNELLLFFQENLGKDDIVFPHVIGVRHFSSTIDEYFMFNQFRYDSDSPDRFKTWLANNTTTLYLKDKSGIWHISTTQ